ncbi:phosphotransferase [Catenovulum sp. 2E275]|uniref:phosphotransferase family protein n=1 Tax=Catenovulum sp. 2E275 TaxID=2980497 RepID=UPI0021D2F229|nr:phosphotransferase [Catenovulum sp. 2E275]MCU4675010.1 phosphotransferase [Catenovulum sp. 2E275]
MHPYFNQQELDWLKAQLGDLLSVSPILNSHTNQCFEVRFIPQPALAHKQPNTVLVKKLNTKILSPQSILNERAARRWVQQYKSHLTPTTLAENEQLGLIVDSFIEQIPQHNKAQQINQLAKLMFALHQLPKPETPAILKQQIYTDIKNLLIELNLNPDKYGDLLQAAYKLDQQNRQLCLCHGDLSFENILFAEQHYLIDWEYARLGEPEYDLAASILINQFSETEQQSLLNCYAKLAHQDLTELSQHTQNYLMVLKPLNQLWFNHKHQLQ